MENQPNRHISVQASSLLFEYDENIDYFSLLFSQTGPSEVVVEYEFQSDLQQLVYINGLHPDISSSTPGTSCPLNMPDLLNNVVGSQQSYDNGKHFDPLSSSYHRNFLTPHKVNVALDDNDTHLSDGDDLSNKSQSSEISSSPQSRDTVLGTDGISNDAFISPYTSNTSKSTSVTARKPHKKTKTNPTGAGRPTGEKNKKGTKGAPNPHWFAMLNKLRQQGPKARYDPATDKGTKKEWSTVRRAYLRENKTGVKIQLDGSFQSSVAVTQPVPQLVAHDYPHSGLPVAYEHHHFLRGLGGIPSISLSQPQNSDALNQHAMADGNKLFGNQHMDNSHKINNKSASDDYQSMEECRGFREFEHPRRHDGRVN